jgi:hypothetical protein
MLHNDTTFDKQNLLQTVIRPRTSNVSVRTLEGFGVRVDPIWTIALLQRQPSLPARMDITLSFRLAGSMKTSVKRQC